MSKKKARIISSFTDAGTGESFTANDTPMIDAGAYANYEAAGLVRAPAVERAPRKAVTRKSRSAAPRSETSKPAPAAAPAPEAPAPSI